MTYDAKQRLKILTFQENHGIAAACDAFKVSRRTLYRWRQTLREAGHNVAALAPRSTAPHRRRQARCPSGLVQAIRRLRERYPNLGKQPVQKLLEPWCERHGLTTPSVSTIGRIIAAAPDKMRRILQHLDARGRRRVRDVGGSGHNRFSVKSNACAGQNFGSSKVFELMKPFCVCW